MILVRIVLDILIIWFVLTWTLRIIAWVFRPDLDISEEKITLTWPHAPNRYYKRLMGKGEDRVLSAAAFWINLWFRTSRWIRPARVPMIGAFGLDAVLAAISGPGFGNTVDILVDVYWIWLIVDDLRKDDEWRKKMKKRTEKIVATTAGLKVVPITGGSR